jgi:flagellar basal-body rod protein FlgB
VELFDNTQLALGAAMRGSTARNAALSDNLANVATPGYVRKDVDFHSTLAAAMSAGDNTDAMGFTPQNDTAAPVRADGNSVDVDAENSALAENALEYDAIAKVAGTRLDILKSAMGVA